MSLTWTGLVRRYAEKSNARKYLVLIALADYANEEGICWPSIASIAEWAGCGEKQARRYIREYVNEEMIDIVQKGGGTRLTNDGRTVGISNRYRIVGSKLIPSHAGEGRDSPPISTAEPSHPEKEPSRKAEESSLKKGGEESLRTSIKTPSIEPLKIPRAVLKEAEEYFSEITQIDLPPRETEKERRGSAERWWNPLKDQLRLCKGDVFAWKAGMQYAVKEFDKDGLTYDSPASFSRKFTSMIGKAKRGAFKRKDEPKGTQGGREFLAKQSGL